jgi:hypothetical protein
MKRWWVKFCECGRWREARPANEWWEKSADEVEVSEEEFLRLKWSQGKKLRDWYIGSQLTRIVNEHECS